MCLLHQNMYQTIALFHKSQFFSNSSCLQIKTPEKSPNSNTGHPISDKQWQQVHKLQTQVHESLKKQHIQVPTKVHKTPDLNKRNKAQHSTASTVLRLGQ